MNAKLKLYEQGDKKNLKDSLSVFFPSKTSEDLKTYLREPYPKYEDRKPEI